MPKVPPVEYFTKFCSGDKPSVLRGGASIESIFSAKYAALGLAQRTLPKTQGYGASVISWETAFLEGGRIGRIVVSRVPQGRQIRDIGGVY